MSNRCGDKITFMFKHFSQGIAAVVAFAVCWLGEGRVFAAPATPTPTAGKHEDVKTTTSATGTVLVVPLHGTVENGLYIYLNRALNQAENRKAAAVVIDMDTPGGRVDAALKIRDRLV